MRNKLLVHKKKHQRKNAALILIVICLLFFICFLFYGNIRLIKKRAVLKQELSGLKDKLWEIAQSGPAATDREFIESSQAYLERIAREELNLQKPGETVVSFPQTIEPVVDKTEGLLQKIKEKLK